MFIIVKLVPMENSIEKNGKKEQCGKCPVTEKKIIRQNCRGQYVQLLMSISKTQNTGNKQSQFSFLQQGSDYELTGITGIWGFKHMATERTGSTLHGPQHYITMSHSVLVTWTSLLSLNIAKPHNACLRAFALVLFPLL